MKGILDDASITIPCPRCGEKTAKTIGWMKAHDQIVCPGCGVTIKLQRDGLLKGTAGAEKAVSGFRDTIRRMNQRR
jgi:ribosomal protein S27E